MEWRIIPPDLKPRVGDVVRVDDGTMSGLWVVTEEWFMDAPFAGGGEIAYGCSLGKPFPQATMVRLEDAERGEFNGLCCQADADDLTNGTVTTTSIKILHLEARTRHKILQQ